MPLALGYFRGMRLEEIRGLEWEQVDLLSNTISLRAGETKNDSSRTIPVIPQLRTLLIAQRAKRQPECPYVCFRLDRRGHAAKLGGFRKAWQSRCVKLGLGRMEPATDPATGETVYAKPRVDRLRSKPKVKMVYCGLIFHDVRQSCARSLLFAGVPEKVAREITGHKTRSMFDRYPIVAPKELAEAGKKRAAFHEFGGQFGDNLHRNAAGIFYNALIVNNLGA